MRLPRTVRPRAAAMGRAKAGHRVSGAKKPRRPLISEASNRCAQVTDKELEAWQKVIGRQGFSLKSVYREWPRVALAAEVGPVYRLRERLRRACNLESRALAETDGLTTGAV